MKAESPRQKILTYYYFIRDVMYVLQERHEEEKHLYNKIATQVSEEVHLRIGALIAYDYFFGIVAKLALAHEIPPYIWHYPISRIREKKGAELEKEMLSYHFPGKQETEIIQAYDDFLAELVATCKKEKTKAFQKNQALRKANPIRSAIWSGAHLLYYSILDHIYNQAYLSFQVPIRDFLSQEDIDNEDLPPYLDMF
ncbi:MAG: hypothetical protein AAF380_00230 [Bacteroidota bacterium]